ncbi:HAD family hydrolase [Catellatospora sp. KI3]|uniref:HAD family hydrolase n=1 Tax=Catellatospora sp. KI3 TaxID=3041620 RepID=UPI002482AFB7|nr:HAD family hydrolase [Catellatospora sp. KI3]MDI1464303.1 HAD family hydrolase [Catellatospora sp. KI3]
MTTQGGLADLLAPNRRLLLDFDGPVCSVFAGYTAPAIASELVELVRRTPLNVSKSLEEESDPLEVLRWVGTNGSPSAVCIVEEALCAAELRAVESAEATPFAREVIITAFELGLRVAIVSNNSAAAINAYLEQHQLADYILMIVGRAYAEPDLMKPNPAPILRAVHSFGVGPADCVLIGDSMTDIQGARAAGVPVIGYANRPHKVAPFTAAGTDVVVTSMKAIVQAMTQHRA